MKITVDTSAFDAEGCIEELQRRMLLGVTRACQDMEDEAVVRCPVDTGDLAQSITAQITDQGDRVEGVVGTGIDYAVYVHEGTGIHARHPELGRQNVPWEYRDELGIRQITSGIKPNPFLEEAFNAKRDRAEKIIQEAVRNG